MEIIQTIDEYLKYNFTVIFKLFLIHN